MKDVVRTTKVDFMADGNEISVKYYEYSGDELESKENIIHKTIKGWLAFNHNMEMSDEIIEKLAATAKTTIL